MEKIRINHSYIMVRDLKELSQRKPNQTFTERFYDLKWDLYKNPFLMEYLYFYWETLEDAKINNPQLFEELRWSVYARLLVQMRDDGKLFKKKN